MAVGFLDAKRVPNINWSVVDASYWDHMVAAYVPYAEGFTPVEAQALAYQLDQEAATQLEADCE